MRVLIFGDSITQGFWDTEGGWAGRLRKFYDTKQLQDLRNNDEPTIFNLGISGDITEGVLKRFDNEVEARKWRWQYEQFSFVFAIGINDSVIEGDVERSNSAKYAEELNLLITKAKSTSGKILFVGLTPVVETAANNRSSKYKEYTNSRIQQFNETLQKVASENNLQFVPIFDEFKGRLDAGEDLLADGLHPNNKGHELIYSLVKPELEKLLG